VIAFQLPDPVIVTDRPADGFRAPQRQVFRVLVERRGEKVGEVVDSVQQRLNLDHAIVLAREVRPDARPRPILGTCAESGSNRIEGDIARSGIKVAFIHRHGADRPCQRWPVQRLRALTYAV